MGSWERSLIGGLCGESFHMGAIWGVLSEGGYGGFPPSLSNKISRAPNNDDY
jgi:hypothetical protein